MIRIIVLVLLVSSCCSTKEVPETAQPLGSAATDLKKLKEDVAWLKEEVAKRDTLWVKGQEIGLGTKNNPLTGNKITALYDTLAVMRKNIIELQSRLPRVLTKQKK